MNGLGGLVPQEENLFFVEQARKPVQENGARCEFKFRCLGSRSSGINYLWFRNGLYQFLTRKA